MFCELSVASRFTEGYGEQCLPYIFLKLSAAHIESDRKLLAFPGEVFAQLPLCFDENRVLIILNQIAEAHTARAVIFSPQNGGEALVAGG